MLPKRNSVENVVNKSSKDNVWKGKVKRSVLVSGHQNKGQSVFRGTAYEDHLKALTRVKDRVRM